MSLITTYQKQVEKLKRDIHNKELERSKNIEKIARLEREIHRIKTMINKIASMVPKQSYQRKIDRHKDEIYRLKQKNAKIDTAIMTLKGKLQTVEDRLKKELAKP